MSDVNAAPPTERLRASALHRSAHDTLDGRAQVRRKHLLETLESVAAADAPVTRASIVRATRLTSASMSSLMAELIELRVVADGELLESTGGKPATRVSIDDSVFVVVVVIVYGRAIETVAVDLAGRRRAQTLTRCEHGPDAAAVAEAARAMVVGFADRVLSVCVRSPGVTDGRTVIASALLDWEDVPLADLIEQETGLPTIVINDAIAEAVGETVADRADGTERLMIRLGEGIGGALSIGHDVLTGAANRLGEIGHVRFGGAGTDADCRCGNRGCLETTASLTAMLGRGYHDELDEDEIRRLAVRAEHDPGFARGAEALGQALQTLSAMTDPHEIVLAGRAPLLGARFLELVDASFRGRHALGTTQPPIRYARGGDVCVGPARTAARHVFGSPLSLPTYRALRSTDA